MTSSADHCLAQKGWHARPPKPVQRIWRREGHERPTEPTETRQAVAQRRPASLLRTVLARSRLPQRLRRLDRNNDRMKFRMLTVIDEFTLWPTRRANALNSDNVAPLSDRAHRPTWPDSGSYPFGDGLRAAHGPRLARQDQRQDPPYRARITLGRTDHNESSNSKLRDEMPEPGDLLYTEGGQTF